ncbi:3,4-dihydroxy-2-butanone-4-phosphate synthase [Amycolatopsis sp. NPDC004368]
MTEHLQHAVASLAAGRPVLVTGTHADLVFAAEDATPRLVAFAVRHTDGFLCAALPEETCDRLNLPPMPRASPDAAAFTVTVDALGGTTGISATDRSRTLRRLAHPTATSADFTRPGHVVPIRTARTGAPHHSGRAEAALDLVRLAGKREAAVLSGLVSSWRVGEMAGAEELAAFAAEHSLPVVSAAQVLALRKVAPCPRCGHAS